MFPPFEVPTNNHHHCIYISHSSSACMLLHTLLPHFKPNFVHYKFDVDVFHPEPFLVTLILLFNVPFLFIVFTFIAASKYHWVNSFFSGVNIFKIQVEAEYHDKKRCFLEKEVEVNATLSAEKWSRIVRRINRNPRKMVYSKWSFSLVRRLPGPTGILGFLADGPERRKAEIKVSE